MTATLAFAQSSWDELCSALEADQETAWVLLARHVGDVASSDVTLLVREVVSVSDDAYTVRTGDRISITPVGWLPTFVRADAEDCVPIFVHTHPGAPAPHSRFDLQLDDELARVADVRLESGAYASLVLGGSATNPEFAGRVNSRDKSWIELDRVRVVGQRLSLYTHDGPDSLPMFDRQVRAFGPDGQKLLEQLRVGVVGAGGTGSAIIEQLVRSGVRDLVIIDPQKLANTNVTRVYGSTLDQVDHPKVEVATEHAKRIGLGVRIKAIVGDILDEENAKALAHCDIIFGCTDDHAGRLVMTRLPQVMLQLLIDCGVVIDSRQGILFDIFARVSVVTPTTACLVCTGDVDSEIARVEGMRDDERKSMQRQGYAPELDHPDPSVITFTTMAAALAVNELLSRLFGYCDEDPANRLVSRIGSREISKTRHDVRGTHRCGKSRHLAAGLEDPFLGYGWSHA